MRTPPPALDPGALCAEWRTRTPQSPDLTLACKLVTPLYGGGVEAGEIDEALPIRASSIRGQLRFWWRIACGGADRDDPERLFERERAIWGGIGAEGPVASRVRVVVRTKGRAEVEPVFEYHPDRRATGRLNSTPRLKNWIGDPLAYALFPAQGKLTADGTDVEKKPHALMHAGLRFELQLSMDERLDPQQRHEVEVALRWWASFGGIGARTRRGLGAVEADSLTPVDASEVEAAGGWLCEGRQGPDARSAHERAIGLLKRFRQGEGMGRNHGSVPKRPGRSCWPEPDAIRKLSGCSSSDHAKPFVDCGPVFPRAAFGLPIVFHFKDAPSGMRPRRDQEPIDHVLEPADLAGETRERMASPLILRPYRDAERRWRPAALLLPGWEQALTISLKFSQPAGASTPRPWPADPQERTRLAEQVKPLKENGQTDALRAFMAFFEQEA